MSEQFKSVSTTIDPEATKANLARLEAYYNEIKGSPAAQSTSKKGKLRWSLLPTAALREVVKVLEMGAAKHSKNGWREGAGLPWHEFTDALERHLHDFKEGKDLDDESKLIQAAHIACNALFLAEYQLKQLGKDDRFKYQEKA